MKESIFSYLTFRDLINYDNTQSVPACEAEWAYKRKADRYMFKWKACEREMGKNQKWNYCLTKALVLFIEKFPACKASVVTGIRTYCKHKVLIDKFPSFGSYIQMHLVKVTSNINPPNIDGLRMEVLHAGMDGFGGESLLQGLFELGDLTPTHAIGDNESSVEWLKRSISQDATLAATLALAPGLGRPNMPPKVAFDLAIEALQKGDRAQFEKLVDATSISKLIELADEKLTAKCYFSADLLYAKPLAYYKDVSEGSLPSLVVNASVAKIQLNQDKEADKLFSRALLILGDNISAKALSVGGFIKFSLDQYPEADEFLTRALIRFGDNPTAEILALSALVKYALKQYQEADKLCTRAILAFGDNVPKLLLTNAAIIKRQLEQQAEVGPKFTERRSSL